MITTRFNLARIVPLPMVTPRRVRARDREGRPPASCSPAPLTRRSACPGSLLTWSLTLALGLGLAMPLAVRAFPPAPHHLIYGAVRDEMGEPISLVDGTVILETISGVQVQAGIVPALEPGINYRLRIPMDAGNKADLYKSNALKPTASFRLRVRLGGVVYLPIEMAGDFAHLGNPAETTELNLTLGEDTDGDGLPDAWERALIAALGGTNTLSEITPGGDADGDGLSNASEYRAGTFAFDEQDGFSLALVQLTADAAVLEFLAIRERTYSIWGSTDMRVWTPVEFRIPADGPSSPRQSSYRATEVRLLRVEVPDLNGTEPHLYFKAMVQ